LRVPVQWEQIDSPTARERAAGNPSGETMPAKKARTATHAQKKSTTPKAPARAAAKPPAASPASAAPAPAAGVPNAIGVIRHHFDYTSHDVPGIRRFYTQVMGFTRFVEEPEVGYLTIQTTPTTSIGFMSPMPGPPEQWRPPGEPALYFFVKDVDRVHKDLVAKGVSFHQPPTDMPWGHRLAMCRDPEGRMVCLAQVTSRG
jgi:predicted enzyme related to lactoylglutathione lyase